MSILYVDCGGGAAGFVFAAWVLSCQPQLRLADWLHGSVIRFAGGW